MSQVSVFNCDGPSCMRSDDMSGDERSLMDAGWLMVSLVDDEEERVVHLCSYECMAEWTQENL